MKREGRGKKGKGRRNGGGEFSAVVSVETKKRRRWNYFGRGRGGTKGFHTGRRNRVREDTATAKELEIKSRARKPDAAMKRQEGWGNYQKGEEG